MAGSGAAPVAIVLAAGSSSRLWPLRDKALVRVAGQSLLRRHLEALASVGIRQAVIVCNDQNDAAIRIEADGVRDRIVSSFVRQRRDRPGMGGAILAARDALDERQRAAPIYVTQAHDVVDLELHEAVLRAWDARPGSGFLAGWRTPDGEYFPGGYLVVDAGDAGDARIVEVIEKPGADHVPPGRLVTIVAHLHPDVTRLCEAIEAAYAASASASESMASTDDHYERAMSSLFASQDYRAIEYRGAWYPLKYPWHLLGITGYVLGQLAGVVDAGASVSPGANISGPVHLGRGARILWGADIKGPAWIGEGTLVGQFVQVRESFIGDGCMIGVHSEVNRSYVGDGATMHAARVLDSVVAQAADGVVGANVSAGVVTANLRIDGGVIRSRVNGDPVDTGLHKFGAIIGAGAFISIQAGTMPGVKLGEQSTVHPGVIVYHDVADGATMRDRQPPASDSATGPGD